MTPGGTSTVRMHTKTTHRTTKLTKINNFGWKAFWDSNPVCSKLKLTMKQLRKNYRLIGEVWSVPRLCELYPGICLTTEEKARKNLSQGSRRVPVGTMKTECTEQNKRNNKNT